MTVGGVVKNRWRLIAAWILAISVGSAPIFLQSASASNAVPINLPELVSTAKSTFTPNVVIEPDEDGVTTQVWGYVPMGGVMYACGDFSQVRSADDSVTYDRSNLFAFDPYSGAVSDFAPVVNGPVYTCAPSPDGQSIYIGGQFTTVNGQAATNIAKIDMATGQLVPAFQASADRLVTEVQVVGGRLLVGGSFAHIDGQAQPGLATVDPESGTFDPYLDLAIAGQVAVNSGPTRVFRFAISPNERYGVAIGNFTTVNGVSHMQAFRFNLGATVRLAKWDNPHFHEACGVKMPVWTRDVQFSPNGKFFVIDGTGGRGPEFCDTAIRWETKDFGATVEPTWINHTCIDTLHSVAVTNSNVYVQGHQKCVTGKNGHRVPRFGIAALSAKTGFARFWRSDQTRHTGGKFLMVTDSSTNEGFPSGLWAGCDCGPEGGIIFRAYVETSASER